MAVSADAEAVYRRLSSPVLGYLRASGADEPEDVLGEVFLQVARDLPLFVGSDDDDAVRRWVFTIARNRMIDAVRRAARRPLLDTSGADVPEGEVAAPDDGPDPQLVAALARLTPEQREVLALRFVADLPVEDVAHMTRRTSGAVKAIQHRALESLRSAVSERDRQAL